jgi:hypothetical protein
MKSDRLPADNGRQSMQYHGQGLILNDRGKAFSCVSDPTSRTNGIGLSRSYKDSSKFRKLCRKSRFQEGKKRDIPLPLP